MGIRIALAGNPNCGKTTMFNALTGANQYVGNWPGVTVEKREGFCTRDKEVVVIDLPGVYSLSPYSPEEVVTRDYLLGDIAGADGRSAPFGAGGLNAPLAGGAPNNPSVAGQIAPPSAAGWSVAKPDVVINLVDATNLERNLYLTTQILDLGLPVVVALNMVDLVEKNGDKIDVVKLSRMLGCPVVETSALKGRGMDDLLKAAIDMAGKGVPATPEIRFTQQVEEAISCIIDVLGARTAPSVVRWYALKLLEGEQRTIEALNLSAGDLSTIAAVRDTLETAQNDDAESIVAGERYDAVDEVVSDAVKKSLKGATATQKIDRVVTNRWLGIPLFVAIMTLVYLISVSTVGTLFTDWANEGVFGDGWLYTNTEQYDGAVAAWEETVTAAEESGASESELATLAEAKPDPASFGVWVPGLTPVATEALESNGVAPWLTSLVVDGIIAGVGAVLGFVPQMIVLFLLLSVLEACGYLARVAFIMDRIFRKFGLSGKSFIPMLIASGCSVPAIMATKTIENENDRRMTIITTTMIPCGAKLPIIALVFGAIAGGDSGSTWWIAPVFYFLGVIAVIVSGIMLRKTRMFAGEATPFIMELPAYHLPDAKSVAMSTWERVRSFIVKAGTIIFLSSLVIWLLMNFGFYEGSFGLLDTEAEGYIQHSLMAGVGNALAWMFAPLGFGSWESTVTSITGLVAKENVVATVGILTSLGDAGEADPSLWMAFGALLGGSVPAIMAFCAFNLLCAPCFAAIGTIRRQMASVRWTWFAIGYMTLFAWAVALMVYQFGMLLGGGGFNGWTAAAFVVLAAMLFQLLRPMPRHGSPVGTARLKVEQGAA